jgi:hypothetical protein
MVLNQEKRQTTSNEPYNKGPEVNEEAGLGRCIRITSSDDSFLSYRPQMSSSQFPLRFYQLLKEKVILYENNLKLWDVLRQLNTSIIKQS